MQQIVDMSGNLGKVLNKFAIVAAHSQEMSDIMDCRNVYHCINFGFVHLNSIFAKQMSEIRYFFRSKRCIPNVGDV